MTATIESDIEEISTDVLLQSASGNVGLVHKKGEILCNISELVYRDEAEFKNLLEAHYNIDPNNINFFSDSNSGADGAVITLPNPENPEAPKIIIAARGTSDLQDMITDASVFPENREDGHAHGGFSKYKDGLWDKSSMRDYVEGLMEKSPNAEVMSMGHSLGAAAATLIAEELILKKPLKKGQIKLTTFGGPRVLEDKRADRLLEALGQENIARYVFALDPVKDVPLRTFFGWINV